MRTGWRTGAASTAQRISFQLPQTASAADYSGHVAGRSLARRRPMLNKLIALKRSGPLNLNEVTPLVVGVCTRGLV